ncbi:MAG: TM2 domain-containing protein [Actinomycetota bacterium]|nr:TM2 domain-containing protein [Actinomycetota bacterium]
MSEEKVPAAQPVYAPPKPTVDESGNPISPKSRLVAAILAWFLGIFGIHRFYVGKVGTGVLMIVTLGGVGIWVLIDLIMILVGSFRDKEERLLINWS